MTSLGLAKNKVTLFLLVLRSLLHFDIPLDSAFSLTFTYVEDE